MRNKTNEDIDGFSQLGLRTLLVCYKEMSEEELSDGEIRPAPVQSGTRKSLTFEFLQKLVKMWSNIQNFNLFEESDRKCSAFDSENY